MNPPTGPLAPTGKTLQQIEARTPVQSLTGSAAASFVITQPGNYYLTGDIVRAAGKDAIVIAASNVTLDLNGFSLIGNPGGGGGIESGITIQGSQPIRGVTVRNGRIRGWTFYGVIGFAAECVFEDLQVWDNAAGGIEMATTHNSRFERCSVGRNGEIAIGAGRNCVVSKCVIESSTWGVLGQEGCVVRECALANIATGGVQIGGGVVEACTFRNISAPGGTDGVAIRCDGIAAVRGCTVDGAGLEGIRVVNGSTVEGNSVARCAVGILGNSSVGPGGRIEGNHVTSCPVGVRVSGPAAYLVVRNSVVSSATPFDVAAPSKLGTVQSTPVGAGAWDNFAY